MSVKKQGKAHHDINGLDDVKQTGLVEYVYHKALILLEDIGGNETLLSWLPIVSHPKLAPEFKTQKFMKAVVLEVMKERGCVGPLLEVAKALMTVDFGDMKSRGRYLPLEAYLQHCLEYSRPGRPYSRAPSADEPDKARDQSDDPRVLVPELARFCMKQLLPRSQVSGEGALPKHVVDNLMTMLLQVWQHMRAETMPAAEVPNMLETLRDTLKAWGTVPMTDQQRGGGGARLFGSELNRGLSALHMFVKRALELEPAAAELPVYSSVRVMLLRLQRRVQVEEGQWARLAVAPLHSPLPNPPAGDVSLTSYQSNSLASMQGREPMPVLPTSCSLLNLDGWVKVGPGRVRPWSAVHRPESPLGIIRGGGAGLGLGGGRGPGGAGSASRQRGLLRADTNDGDAGVGGSGGSRRALFSGVGKKEGGGGSTIGRPRRPSLGVESQPRAGGGGRGGRGGGSAQGAQPARASRNTMRVQVGIQRITELHQNRIVTRQQEIRRRIASMTEFQKRHWASKVIAMSLRGYLGKIKPAVAEPSIGDLMHKASMKSAVRSLEAGDEAGGEDVRAAVAAAQQRTREMIQDLNYMRRLALGGGPGDEDAGAPG